MEEWDLYDKNGNMINKTIKRGEPLNDNEYHLVINSWVLNSKNELLISQRAATKSFPYKWECTGGSVLKGEKPIEGAIRELKEELGICASPENAILIGKTNRYYKGCPDILYVWIFNMDIDIKELKLQKEEINDVMWANVEMINKLDLEGNFEKNDFFEEVIEYAKNR